MHDFHPHTPEITFFHNKDNTCVLISLDCALFSENEHVVEHEQHAVLSRISSYLSWEIVCYMNRIRFATEIPTYHVRNKGK